MFVNKIYTIETIVYRNENVSQFVLISNLNLG